MTQQRRSRRLPFAAAAVALLTGTTVLTAATSVAPASAAPAAKSLAGKTIFLDPGHQGSSAGHNLNAQVPDGRGGKKACQTTGATAVTGAKEHTINWQITQLVKAGLEDQGARVVLSRPDDTGWGGCVDQRAAAASRSGAAVAVSIHADSTTTGADAGKKGFHLIVPKLPLPDATASRVQGGEGRKASTVMRDAFLKAGFPAANYAGADNGIQTRSDIAGSNLTTVPLVFVEMGNLSNPAEAKQLSDKGGQLKYAMAITNGILGYVKGDAAASATTPNPQASTPPATDDPGLSIVLPFVQKLLATSDPQVMAQLMLGEGQDVSAQVLKAMLGVIYGLFGGKLPI
ncbi:N-acetylmuramoyl-L-alanine amidase [Gordonia sp. ABSL1-1]|uniref:N-acetylmuramoyl-L-alanine amidase n=1 Tax=Gordonia sp. ABSL1-1 TaxID=3053923 RepID=UPI00257394B8|nr:N-acetylmuramoyl-L-alanine amidase [Gordonia sp. ABSL1-1]MDL9935763.1 N-acetylmuramoyl-L-alanine amidase [Gordonia sp. ABSL1-1]